MLPSPTLRMNRALWLDVTAELCHELTVEQMLVDRDRWRVLAGIGSATIVFYARAPRPAGVGSD